MTPTDEATDVDAEDGEVGMDNDEEAGTSSEEFGTGAGKVGMADEGSTGAVGMNVNTAGSAGTALKDSVVTELDIVNERVQFLVSCTFPCESWIGIRTMIQICLTTPVGLEKEGLVMLPIPGDPDIRIDKLNTSDSGGLSRGELRGWDSGELRERK